MKKIQQLLLTSTILLWSSILLSGQTSKPSFHLEIGANGLLSINDKNPIQAGPGTEFQLKLEKPVSKVGSVNFAIAYRQISGYQKKFISVEIVNFFDESHLLLHSKEVAGINYLDASLNWKLKIKEGSAWSVELGFRTSRLMDWKGHEQRAVWATYTTPIYEFDLLGDIPYHIRMDESSPLASDNFSRLDYGVQFQLGFELASGLKLNTGFYKGFSEVFQAKFISDGLKYRLTTISMGLSVRLF